MTPNCLSAGLTALLSSVRIAVPLAAVVEILEGEDSVAPVVSTLEASSAAAMTARAGDGTCAGEGFSSVAGLVGTDEGLETWKLFDGDSEPRGL